MGLSIYDDEFLTDEEKKAITEFQAAFREAQARGDRAGMDSAHAAAERVRASRGYSGGDDGSGYRELGDLYKPAELRAYTPQTEAVNDVYDAAREARVAQLRSAFDANVRALREQRDAVPDTYRDLKNDLAAQAQVSQRGFDEYAAASGLNSGAAGQARLARANTLQAGLTDLGRQEAQALRELDSDEAALRRKLQDDVAQAVAEGEIQRAQELLKEYRRAAESAVTVSQAQAGENYKAWQSAAVRSR